MIVSETPAILPLPAKCVLKAVGPDALSFLQGQFSQDLRGCAVGGVRYGLWLNQKGKVMGESYLLRLDEAAWLIVSIYCSADKIKQRLDEYLIADEVEIEDRTSEFAGAVLKPGLQAKTEDFAEIFGGYQFGMTYGLGSYWLGPVSGLAQISQGRRSMAEGEWEEARVRAGAPKIPVELSEGDLPQEAGLEDVAVSFSKGCYLGQEVMARLHAMGKAKRRLLRVEGTGELPVEFPLDLFSGDKRVGELRSAVTDGHGGWLGLAMLNLFSLEKGVRLARRAGGEPEILADCGEIE